MALGRTYEANSGLVAVTATSAVPILYGVTTSTNTADVVAYRIGSWAGSSASYPSNGSALFQLSRVTGTQAGGTSVTAVPQNDTDIAANTLFHDATGSAITGLTQGVVPYQQVIPFTAGAGWSEWVTPGTETRISASGKFAIYLTISATSTATDFTVGIRFVE
jgi:hypothetical protein